MQCPFCGYPDSKVSDSRPAEEGSSIRRRRECFECGKRFTTFEKVEQIPLMIVKKDGKREVFDNNKLFAGLMKSCEKRPVSTDTIDQVVSEIERELRNSMDKEITSSIVGEKVMEKLKLIDEVAYVRFASVYRQFKDIETFLKEIEVLLQKQHQ